MIATLRFTLPEEQQEFDDAKEGANLRQALFEFDRYLRGIEKHGENSEIAAEHREKLHEILRDNKVSI